MSAESSSEALATQSATLIMRELFLSGDHATHNMTLSSLLPHLLTYNRCV